MSTSPDYSPYYRRTDAALSMLIFMVLVGFLCFLISIFINPADLKNEEAKTEGPSRQAFFRQTVELASQDWMVLGGEETEKFITLTVFSLESRTLYPLRYQKFEAPRIEIDVWRQALRLRRVRFDYMGEERYLQKSHIRDGRSRWNEGPLDVRLGSLLLPRPSPSVHW